MKKNLLLTLVTVLVTFLLIEAGYRLFDPYPYVPPWQVRDSEFAGAYQYHPMLGWSGVPNFRGDVVLPDGRFLVEHNAYGFRDLDDNLRDLSKPAIVFLGDSFTHGHLVEWDEMFVNRVREKLPQYNIYNLGHRGYGTDQSLLTFQLQFLQGMDAPGNIQKVVLMFSENDMDDNAQKLRYSKFKPKFEVKTNGELALTNVPVPKLPHWDYLKNKQPRVKAMTPEAKLWGTLFTYSHALHDWALRLGHLIDLKDVINAENAEQKPLVEVLFEDKLLLTERILSALRVDVEKSGASLVVVAIPSYKEFMRGVTYAPYQNYLREICRNLNIEFMDLAPYFQGKIRRTYIRTNPHWTPYGHRIAAGVLEEYFTRAGK